MTIQIDKLTHFFVCYSLALTIGMFAPLLVAAVSTIAVGALKELLDYVTKKGSPEWWDFLADCIGTIIASLIIIFVK